MGYITDRSELKRLWEVERAKLEGDTTSVLVSSGLSTDGYPISHLNTINITDMYEVYTPLSVTTNDETGELGGLFVVKKN